MWFFMMEVGDGDDIKRSDISIPFGKMVRTGAGAHRAWTKHPGILRNEGVCRKHILLLAVAVVRCGLHRTGRTNGNNYKGSCSRRLDTIGTDDKIGKIVRSDN